MTTPGVEVVESHPVPAEDDATAQQVAAILATAATIPVLAAEIVAVLRPWRISERAVTMALDLSSTSHRAYGRFAAHGLDRSSTGLGTAVARKAARAEIFYRASYVVASSSRIQKAIDSAPAAGKTVGEAVNDALRTEAPYSDGHVDARTKRLDTAGKVGAAADQWGKLLGWYRDEESNSERECRLADGNNFYALDGTSIGLPGTVHRHCRCVAGPPHPRGQLVDDVLAGNIVLVPRRIAS